VQATTVPAERPDTAARSEGPDEIGEALLDAAATVFARQGFDGTRIGDIVRQAGLSTGAAYGRFPSREALLRQAVITRSVPHVEAPLSAPGRVGDLVARSAAHIEAELDETDALILEAFVAARRHPPIAEALQEAQSRWRADVVVLVDAAIADGSLRVDLDVDAVLYFVRVLRLGRLLMRASGLPAPGQEGWEALVRGVIASLGAGAGAGAGEPAVDASTDITTTRGEP
jgi:AcrR family transcriptional regulator